MMNLAEAAGGGGKVRQFAVRVSTIDADLEFKLEESALGRDLFDLVCRTLGLREVWYFGIQYTSTRGYCLWLHMNKKVLKHDLKRSEHTLYFQFVVKFYPEIVEDELIQPVTRHLFYMQVKQAILRMELYCPPDIAVLLATYMTQAELGDYTESTASSGAVQLEQLLPARVLSQYHMTPDMWLQRINTWWHNNKGMSREDAELEYLRVAQDLKMFGVHYFLIQNKNKTKLWLGVAPHGVNIFEEHNKQVPKTRLKWDEIRNISFKDKKFTIKTTSNESTSFFTEHMLINECILDLCMGAHNLYLRRRQTDSLEVQHMKMQAKQDRLGRMADVKRYEQERSMREAAERERDLLREQLADMADKLSQAEGAVERASEMADLLAEKARISEEEALVLSKRAAEAEAEVHRINISAIKSEEAKMVMERKARDAELLAARMAHERCGRSEQSIGGSPAAQPTPPPHMAASYPAFNAAHFSGGGGGSSPSPHAATCLPSSSVLLATASSRSSLSCSQNQLAAGGPPQLEMYTAGGGGGSGQHQLHSADDLPVYGARDEAFLNGGGVQFGLENGAAGGHSQLQMQLAQLRMDIETLKVENRETDDDRIYAENMQRGETKYSTLRKTAVGTTKERLQLFEGL